MRPQRRVILLGATGSIGRQTVEVVEHLRAMSPDVPPVRIVGMAARSSAAALHDLARRAGCAELALSDERAAGAADAGVRLRIGPDAAERLIREVDADVVLGAMVGVAGLSSTLAAIELGRDVALANKETLVAAGDLVVRACTRSGARLLPVDSEHSGVWQCLTGLTLDPSAPPLSMPTCVSRVILTASGGPFRGWTSERLAAATPEQALNHPTWRMGPKVTIDSASLMNKALELIEAHWLFGLSAERLGVLIHPQSIVHALVECCDGSTIAQLGSPDMRGPIQHALTFPARSPGGHSRLDLARAGRLDFEPVDPERFPAVGLALRAIRAGGAAGTILNAANEEAVGTFLAGRIPFPRIVELAAGAMEALGAPPLTSIEDVHGWDARARAWTLERLRGAAHA